MGFVKCFNEVKTASLSLSSTAQKLATPWTLSNSRDGGRTAVEVNNVEGDENAYVGDEDVTTSTGICVKAGESRVFPVQPGSSDYLYVVGSGSIIVADYY